MASQIATFYLDDQAACAKAIQDNQAMLLMEPQPASRESYQAHALWG